MKLVTFKLILWKNDLLKKVTEYNRVINHCTVRPITKDMKNKRRNACKMIIEIDEAIEKLTK